MNTEQATLVQFQPLVKRLALMTLRNLPGNVEFDDLFQAGMIAVHETLPRFDPDRGVKLQTFLGLRIRGAMIDELRRQDWLKRGERSEAVDTGFHMASLDEMAENDEREDLPSEEHTESYYANKQRILKLLAAIEELPERDRNILDCIYNHDMDQAEIGLKYGFSRSRVSQLHTQALARLSLRMKNAGF